MSALGWVALGVLAWLLVAGAVAVAIGRAIRLSELPPDAENSTADPAERCA